MSDLRVITFDGNNVALYDNGSYILVNLPGETIIGTIEKCPTSQVTRCFFVFCYFYVHSKTTVTILLSTHIDKHD